MRKSMYALWLAVLALNILLCYVDDSAVEVIASEYVDSHYINLNQSTIKIDDAFGMYQQIVDKNIYSEMSKYQDNILVDIYGDVDTPMFRKASESLNPCMAFATTWGEAGSSYPGISMTTVMDFNPNTYVYDIDWITVTSNLEEVNDTWYRVNVMDNYNTNEDGNAYRMPVALLQFPKGGDRSTSAMSGLGVGPYQITSTDWDKWELENRVSPLVGFRDSVEKLGDNWIKCGIDPISDLTVYAAMSLGHQGGGLINMDFGKELINTINTPKVQEAFNIVGRQMYIDLRDKAYEENVSLANVNVSHYVNQLQEMTGINFSKYNGGVGSTNKGNYVAAHCLRYVFYKNYFTASD